MIDAVLNLTSGGGATRAAQLSTYLDATDAEWAAERAIGWIKQLRHLDVGGVPMRRRFTCRGDSLWWFSEIYLHKQQAIRQLFEVIAAFDRLIGQEAPRRIDLQSGGPFVRHVASRLATLRGLTMSGTTMPPMFWRSRLLRLDARGRWLHTSALGSRLRSRPAVTLPSNPAVAAFIHRAFWREESGDGSAEAYIGPVLQALERRVPSGEVAYVSLGPSENFSARRWWHALRSEGEPSSTYPVEMFSSLQDLRESRAMWGARHAHRRTLWSSEAIREHAVIEGVDCWPIVREELAGIASLQWPWSVRAMDEAGAALETLQPRCILTYAEAGGWGRALMLECRRRGIPSAGLQHGFIYRHWLNYLHDADEMAADPGNAGDLGFPRPDVTVLFDEYAAQHLTSRGSFPPDSLTVAGSPRLDALVRAARDLSSEARSAKEEARSANDGLPSEARSAKEGLLLVVAKFREARRPLAEFLDAAAKLPDVQIAIKTHPAETPDVYGEVVSGKSNVVVLPAAAPLAPLLRASRAIVTVNSTVALDAAVLGVPALVIGLPNNLSPFVDAGAMAGASSSREMEGALRQILYDEKFRQQLERARGLLLARFRILSDGGAAERSAEAVLKLVE
jgi:hypothetical protein